MRQLAVICVVVLLTAPPTIAHHSAAMFEDAEVAARGTVADLTWRNPHVLLHWDAKDKNGKLVRWVGELASVSSLLADGFLRTSVKPGDDVIVVYRPAKAGTPESVIGAILRPDGSMILPWSRQGFGGAPEEERARRTQQRLKLLAPFGIRTIE